METTGSRALAAIAAKDDANADTSAPLRILIASAEFTPLAAETCVAKVASGLGGALSALGHDVRAVIPRHACIDSEAREARGPLLHLRVPMLGVAEKTPVFEMEGDGGIPVLVIQNDRYFDRPLIHGHEDDDERYVFFSKAVVELLASMHWQPDIVHCIEWHAALVPDYLSSQSGPRRSLVPVSLRTLCDLDRYAPSTPRGRREMDSPQLSLDLAARGVLTADAVSICGYDRSLPLAQLELLTPYFQKREEPISCLPGPEVAEQTISNPVWDPALHTHYGPESIHRKGRNKQALQLLRGLAVDASTPLIGMIDLFDDAHGFAQIPPLLSSLGELDAQLVVYGCGNARYEQMFARFASENPLTLSFRRSHPDAVDERARRLYAGADFFLTPAVGHPGIPIALCYGALPICPVSEATLPSDVPGFSFDALKPGALLEALHSATQQFRASELWNGLVLRALSTSLAWNEAARECETFYRKALLERGDKREKLQNGSSSMQSRSWESTG